MYADRASMIKVVQERQKVWKLLFLFVTLVMNAFSTNLKPLCPTHAISPVLPFLIHLLVHTTAPGRASLAQNPMTKKTIRNPHKRAQSLLKEESVTLGVRVASWAKTLTET